MDKLRVQVNGRGYYLKTDAPDEVLKFAKKFEEQILYITMKMNGISEAEATALSALLLMGESLKDERSPQDQELIEDMTGQIDVLEERIETLTKELSSHNDAETAFRTEITELRKRENELVERLSELTEREHELTDAYNNSEASLEDTKSALVSANKIIAQLNTEKFTEVAANEALRNELEAAQGRLESSNKVIAELNGKLTQMEINNINVYDGKISASDEELKKLRSDKEKLEIELGIAREEIEKLRSSALPPDKDEQTKRIAEYEKRIKQLEGRGAEIDKLRNILAETEHSIRHKVDEKEEENNKLRNILKNYEKSYSICVDKKEAEIISLQREIERLKAELKIKEEEKMSGSYVQTTFDAQAAEGKETSENAETSDSR